MKYAASNALILMVCISMNRLTYGLIELPRAAKKCIVFVFLSALIRPAEVDKGRV